MQEKNKKTKQSSRSITGPAHSPHAMLFEKIREQKVINDPFSKFNK